MNTKEAIEILKGFKGGLSNKHFKIEVDFFNDIIGLLQRGENYEKIFNTILNWTIHDGSFIPVKELINLEQKYFPNLICGNCKNYNSDTLFCDKHPEYGELVEQDTCDDWTEDE